MGNCKGIRNTWLALFCNLSQSLCNLLQLWLDGAHLHYFCFVQNWQNTAWSVCCSETANIRTSPFFRFSSRVQKKRPKHWSSEGLSSCTLASGQIAVVVSLIAPRYHIHHFVLHQQNVEGSERLSLWGSVSVSVWLLDDQELWRRHHLCAQVDTPGSRWVKKTASNPTALLAYLQKKKKS